MAERVRDDYFVVGENLFDHLAAAFEGTEPKVKIISWAEPDPEKVIKQFSPALVFGYMGDDVNTSRPGGTTTDARRQIITQKWLVCGVFKDARSQHAGTASRAEAGPVISRMLTAMMGFEALPGLKVRRLYPSAPAQFDNGFLLLPYAFAVDIPF